MKITIDIPDDKLSMAIEAYGINDELFGGKMDNKQKAEELVRRISEHINAPIRCHKERLAVTSAKASIEAIDVMTTMNTEDRNDNEDPTPK